MDADSATPWASPSARRLPVGAPASGVTLAQTSSTNRRYHLVLKIASGGMGAVYLGFQTGAAGFRRPVAIKRAHAHLSDDPEFRQMIIHEARMASLVRHPNVVGVVDVEEVDGELFLVMEYVEGATLAELMVSEPALPLRFILPILADACRGLEALHSAVDDRGMPLGLVHRDVSPQNIIVGVDGIARIADFGIAKAYEGPTSGLLRGKPAYMAPEYTVTGVATPASDVFGLGVVAWECISRRRLFRGANDLETLERVRSLTIPPPANRESDVPRAVEEALRKALARSLSERYGSARELGAAIEALSSDSALFARPEAVGEHVQAIARSKIEVRRQALAEDTPPHGPLVDVPVEVTPAKQTPTRAEAPLARDVVLRPPPPDNPVPLVIAMGLVLAGALALLNLLRPAALTDRPSAEADTTQTTMAQPAP